METAGKVHTSLVSQETKEKNVTQKEVIRVKQESPEEPDEDKAFFTSSVYIIRLSLSFTTFMSVS